MGVIGVFVANESREPSFASQESLEAKITSTTRGRLYTERNKSCEAFFVCNDVVAVSGICLGSEPVDNRLLQFKALPLGDAPQAHGVRTEYYLSKLSIHDIALVKLDRSYENVQPEWHSRLISDGFSARRWVEEKSKEYCGKPAKNLFVKVYPGNPGEVSGHLPQAPSSFLIDCQGNGSDSEAGCRNQVLVSDKVTLIAKNPKTASVTFERWDSFQDADCPCARENSQSPACSFDVKHTETKNIGCVAIYKGMGIDRPTSRPLIPTVIEGNLNRPITASFPMIPIPGMMDPSPHTGMTRPSESQDD